MAMQFVKPSAKQKCRVLFKNQGEKSVVIQNPVNSGHFCQLIYHLSFNHFIFSWFKNVFFFFYFEDRISLKSHYCNRKQSRSLELIYLALKKTKTKTLYTHWATIPDFLPLLPAPGNHHFILCFYKFNCFRYFLEVESCNICSALNSLFHLV